jgi:regulator of nonsense transcripts 2
LGPFFLPQKEESTNSHFDSENLLSKSKFTSTKMEGQLNSQLFSSLEDDSKAFDQFIQREEKEAFLNVFSSFCRALTRLLIRIHDRLISCERHSRTHYETKGDLSESMMERFKTTHAQYVALKEGLESLAPHLNIKLPILSNIDSRSVLQMVEGKIVFADLNRTSKLKSEIFIDDEERAFYEDIPDLADLIPPAILNQYQNDRDDSNNSHSSSNEEKETLYLSEDPSIENLSAFSQIDPESLPAAMSLQSSISSLNKPLSSAGKNGQSTKPLSTSSQTSILQLNTNGNASLNISEFYGRLKAMNTKVLADQAACDFCHIGTKSQCKILADYLQILPRDRLNLLPYIARFLAILKPYFPDLVASVNESLLGQFVFLSHCHAPVFLTRSRICRYIGEMVKARAMAQTTAFAALKRVVVEDRDRRAEET